MSDTSDSSPWQGWLADWRLAANKESLELFTMSFFPLGKFKRNMNNQKLISIYNFALKIQKKLIHKILFCFSPFQSIPPLFALPFILRPFCHLSGLVLLVPLFLLSHFCFCCPLRWIPWLPLFLLLSILPVFLYNGASFNFTFPVVSGNATLGATANATTTPPIDLIQAYGK